MRNLSISKDWQSLLLLIYSLGGIGMTIIAGVGTIIFLGLRENELVGNFDATFSPLASVLAAGAMLSFTFLLMPLAWLSFQRLRGVESVQFSMPRFPAWSLIALMFLWVIVMLLGTNFHSSRGARLFLPPLHFLSIALPIYMMIRFGISRIQVGSRQQAWGAFGSGLLLGPGISAAAELILVVMGLVIAGIYIVIDPVRLFEFQTLFNQIENAPNLESTVPLLGPLIQSPIPLILALLFLSVLVPIIEEISKTAGLWLIADRLSFPAQGFALGLLSGAGFALAESLFATMTPDSNWYVAISIRSVSGCMHMLTAGLAGWGIAYARVKQDYLRMAGLMILAMLVHGAWNGGVVLSVAGGARVMLAIPDVDFFGTLLTFVGGAITFALFTGMFGALFLINRDLRSAIQTSFEKNQDGDGRVE